MTSSAQVRAHRRDLEELTGLARNDLRLVAAGLTGSAEAVRDGLMDIVPALVDTYGVAATGLGADFYDEARQTSGIKGRFPAIPADLPGSARTEALVRWGVDPLFGAQPDKDSALARIEGGLQRIVANADRMTVVQSVLHDPQGRGWQRLTAGGCDFCRMLTGRGAVYTEATVRFRSHDHCHCTAAAVWEGQESLPSKALIAPTALAPEEPFVQKIVKMLTDGDRKQRSSTAADLRRVLDDPNTKDLSRANIEEAFRRVELEQAAKANVPAPAPVRVQVAQDSKFTSEQLSAMSPESQWSEEKRTAILEALRGTDEGKILADTLDRFQDGGSIARLRSTIDKVLSGQPVNETGRRRVEALLDAIRNAPTDWAPETLYRGMTVKGKLENVIKRYEAGGDMDLSLTSFSSDRSVAKRFQDMTSKGGGETKIMVELVGPNKKALPIQNLARDRRLHREKEWVTSGRFRIVSVKKSAGTILLRVEQIGTL